MIYSCDVEYMSGEDSIIERSRILHRIKEIRRGIILVATQVVEAGVDIDMDIGYKDISKLDSGGAVHAGLRKFKTGKF